MYGPFSVLIPQKKEAPPPSLPPLNFQEITEICKTDRAWTETIYRFMTIGESKKPFFSVDHLLDKHEIYTRAQATIPKPTGDFAYDWLNETMHTDYVWTAAEDRIIDQLEKYADQVKKAREEKLKQIRK